MTDEPGPQPVTYAWAGATDVGRVRDHNEDSLWPVGHGAGPGPLVFAVADGLGGLQAGEVASRLAVDAVAAIPVNAGVPVADRVRAGDDAVVQWISESDDIFDSATTLTVAQLGSDGRLDIGHVGDSRLYAAGSGVFVQITTDQTVAQRKVDAGLITEREATLDPGRHILTSACGLLDVSIQHIAGLQLKPGNRVLMCSDGLSEMLTDGEIAAILHDTPSPAATVRALIGAANEAGGRDNITVIVINVVAAD
jgi:protein phosphatase